MENVTGQEYMVKEEIMAKNAAEIENMTLKDKTANGPCNRDGQLCKNGQEGCIPDNSIQVGKCSFPGGERGIPGNESTRLYQFTGHFGSGKTEVAINFAVKLSEMGKETAIVDLDIVNPYFRTVDVRSDLEKRGVRVIASQFASTQVDIPALPPEIDGLIENRGVYGVFDVGGDAKGARALARYRKEIEVQPYEMFLVVNTRRPETANADDILIMLRSIEESSGLQITALVNNTNLQRYTLPAHLLEGQSILEEVSEKTGIPIAFASGYPEVLKAFSAERPGVSCFELSKYMRFEWEEQPDD